MTKQVLLVLSLICTPFAHADEPYGWPDVTRVLVRNHNERRVRSFNFIKQNPFLITLADHFSLSMRGWGGLTPGSEELTLLSRSGEFKAADGSLRPWRVRYWGGSPDLPLVVYLPGIFQGSTDADSARMIDMLRASGHRVAVLADPLSGEYLANDPVAPVASYEREARVILMAIRELLDLYGGTKARVITASHGAYLGAVAWALDEESDDQVIDDVTLLFPQARLGASLQLLDSYIMTSRLDDPPRAMIGGAFQESLRNLVKRLQKRFVRDAAAGFRARRYPGLAKERLSTYRRSNQGRHLTFRRVVEEYVAEPEVLKQYRSGLDRTMAWLERGHAAHGGAKVRVLIATDDWTNPPGAWSDLPPWLTRGNRTLFVEHAGHAGLVAEKWFRRAILEAMRESRFP